VRHSGGVTFEEDDDLQEQLKDNYSTDEGYIRGDAHRHNKMLCRGYSGGNGLSINNPIYDQQQHDVHPTDVHNRGRHSQRIAKSYQPSLEVNERRCGRNQPRV
jgi:hypothetical protein